MRIRARWSTIAFVLIAVVPLLSVAGAPAEAATCDGAWHRQDIEVGGRISIFNGIVAFSASDVWAVGEGGRDDVPIVEQWDGVSWSRVTIAKVRHSSFIGIGGSGPSDIWIAGSQFVGQTVRPLTEHYDGVSWTAIQAAPATLDDQLLAVTAINPTDAWAVGTSLSTDQTTLAEHWDGSVWSVVPTPNASPDGQDALQAVSAAGSTDVWAADAAAEAGPVALHWEGTTWQAVHLVGGLRGYVYGIGAASPNDVWAVGNRGENAALAEHWDGTQWTVTKTPGGPHGARLLSVWNGGPSEAYAVGYRENTETEQDRQMAYRWDGVGWTDTPVSRANGDLWAVSGIPGQAWAAGDERDPNLGAEIFAICQP